MDGIHDLGGKPGFGQVDRTGEDEVFHGRWEAVVFTMLFAIGGTGVRPSADRFRHAVERIDPEAYLTHGYYGRWLGGIETLLVEGGLLTSEALTRRAVSMGGSEDDLVAARPAAHPDPLGPTPLDRASSRPLGQAPRFRVGDQVRTRAEPSPGHTRLPAYARDRTGEVIAWHDGWVYPDTSAHGQGEQPAHLYTVRFTSEALWGRPGFSVSLDLFEPYLLPAAGAEADE